MEEEHEAGKLIYRYVYGLEKASAVIYDKANTAWNQIQPFGTFPDAAMAEYAVNEEGELEFVSENEFYLSEIVQTCNYRSPGQTMPLRPGSGTTILKLYYHTDRLGSVDFMTSNTNGKVMRYITYDDWGALMSKIMLRMAAPHELDLVQQYTVHPYDQVLGVYFAQARMYDAADRRFMAMDPVKGSIANVQSIAQYTYCLDNPIKYYDSSGTRHVEDAIDSKGVVIMIKEKIYIAALICILFVMCMTASASEGVLPSDALAEIIIEADALLDCPIDIYGTWEVVDFLPNAFKIMGILQPYKYQSMALDALNKKIEFQPKFYRFENSIFNDIEYQIQIIPSDDFDQSGFQNILERIKQLDNVDKELPQFSKYTGVNVDIEKLYVIYVKGVEDIVWSGEHSEEELLATITTEFVLISDNYIYHITSGLLCKRLS